MRRRSTGRGTAREPYWSRGEIVDGVDVWRAPCRLTDQGCGGAVRHQPSDFRLQVGRLLEMASLRGQTPCGESDPFFCVRATNIREFGSSHEEDEPSVRFMVTRLRSLPVLVAAFAPALAGAQDQTVKIGGREVDVWRPRGTASGPQPVIIFSHGFGGCGTQSKFLTQALAEHGYWVFAPNHRDARCGPGGRGGAMALPEASFR